MYGDSDYYIVLQLFISVLSLCSVICQIIVLQSTHNCFQYSLFSFSILNSLLHLVVISLSVALSTDVHITMIGLSALQGSFPVIIILALVVTRKTMYGYILAETIWFTLSDLVSIFAPSPLFLCCSCTEIILFLWWNNSLLLMIVIIYNNNTYLLWHNNDTCKY